MDGNVLAGALREIFSMDVTAARGRCAGCGRTGMVAETRVYEHAAGLVARCPGCDAVLIRLVRAPDRAYLDLHGMSFLQVPMP
jgi:ribosomal protein S27E